jgi:hypothetical protein
VQVRTILCFPDRRLDVVELRTQSAPVLTARSGIRVLTVKLETVFLRSSKFMLCVCRQCSQRDKGGEQLRRPTKQTLSRTQRQSSQPASTSTPGTRHSNSIPGGNHARLCSTNYAALARNPKTATASAFSLKQSGAEKFKGTSKHNNCRVQVLRIQNDPLVVQNPSPTLVVNL